MTTPERPEGFKLNLCQVSNLRQDVSDKLGVLRAKERSIKFWFRLLFVVLSMALILALIFFSGIAVKIIAIVLFAGFLIYLVWMSRIREDKRDCERESRLLAEYLDII